MPPPHDRSADGPTPFCLFIGGTPAAGKTTLAKRLEATGLCRHVSASALIRAARAGESSGRPRVKDAAGSDENQRLLIQAFERVRTESAIPVALDGHFVIPTEAGFVDLGADIFRALRISAALVVTASAEDVVKRLLERDERPRWWDGSSRAIEDLLEREVAVAEAVAAACGVPLRIISVDDDAVASHLLAG